ncbi:hypothetical protein [Streptomyces sp. NPDC051016]|uniref:hypothetical protein n=1 Tax=Streptomyces sp. NPDC051016 TaxID=3365638 RepID=UPI0037B597B2
MTASNDQPPANARRRPMALAAGTAAALGLAAVSLAGPASAASTLTVAKDGSGMYTTVQAAVNAAAAGDTISVAKGTYQEIVNVPVSKTGLTSRAPPATPRTSSSPMIGPPVTPKRAATSTARWAVRWRPSPRTTSP